MRILGWFDLARIASTTFSKWPFPLDNGWLVDAVFVCVVETGDLLVSQSLSGVRTGQKLRAKE
jgi:hypothetical protein